MLASGNSIGDHTYRMQHQHLESDRPNSSPKSEPVETATKTGDAESKERSMWNRQNVNQAAAAAVLSVPMPGSQIAECPGCVAQQGLPHRCGIADEPPSPGSVDHQSTGIFHNSSWHNPSHATATHQTPTGAPYISPSAGVGHMYVLAEPPSNQTLVSERYHMPASMSGGFSSARYASANVAPFYETADIPSIARCSCGDPTCNQFLRLGVVSSTGFQQAAVHSQFYGNRPMYDLTHQRQHQTMYTVEPPGIYQHQLHHQVVQASQPAAIGPHGVMNIHQVVGQPAHLHGGVMVHPLGNFVVGTHQMPNAASVEHSLQPGLQRVSAPVGLPDMTSRPHTDNITYSNSKLASDAHSNEFASEAEESRAAKTDEAIDRNGGNRVASAEKAPDATQAQQGLTTSTATSNFSDKNNAGATREVTILSSVVMSYEQSVERRSNTSSTLTLNHSTSADRSKTASPAEFSTSHVNDADARNTDSKVASQTREIDGSTVPEKDLAQSSVDGGNATTDTPVSNARRNSTLHGSMSFIVDFSDGSSAISKDKAASGAAGLEAGKAAAKREILFRRSMQRSRSIERSGERNGPEDDSAQEQPRTSRRSTRASQDIRRKTLTTVLTPADIHVQLARMSAFTSPQLTRRSGNNKSVTSSGVYSSDEDDENNNRGVAVEKRRPARSEGSRNLTEKPPISGNSTSSARNGPLVAVHMPGIESENSNAASLDATTSSGYASMSAGHSLRRQVHTLKSSNSLGSRKDSFDQRDKNNEERLSPADNQLVSHQRRKRHPQVAGSDTDLIQQMLNPNQQTSTAAADLVRQPATSDGKSHRTTRSAAEKSASNVPAADRKRRDSSDDDNASNASGGTYVLSDAEEENARQHLQVDENACLPESFTASSGQKQQETKQAVIENLDNKRQLSRTKAITDDDVDSIARKDQLSFTGRSKQSNPVDDSTSKRKQETTDGKIAKLLFDSPSLPTNVLKPLSTEEVRTGDGANESQKWNDDNHMRSRVSRIDNSSSRRLLVEVDNRHVETETVSHDRVSRLREKENEMTMNYDVKKTPSAAPSENFISKSTERRAIKSSTVSAAANTEAVSPEKTAEVQTTMASQKIELPVTKIDDKEDTDDVILFIHESDDENNKSSPKSRPASKMTPRLIASSPAGNSKRQLPNVPMPSNSEELRTSSDVPTAHDSTDSGRFTEVDYVAPKSTFRHSKNVSPFAQMMKSASFSSSSLKPQLQLENDSRQPDISTDTILHIDEPFDGKERTEQRASSKLETSTRARICPTTIVRPSDQVVPPAIERFVPISPSSAESSSSKKVTRSSPAANNVSLVRKGNDTRTRGSMATEPRTQTISSRTMPRTQPPLVSPTKDQRFFGGNHRSSAAAANNAEGTSRPARGGSVSPVKAVAPSNDKTTTARSRSRVMPNKVSTGGRDSSREPKTSPAAVTQRTNVRNDITSSAGVAKKSTSRTNRSTSGTRNEDLPTTRQIRRPVIDDYGENKTGSIKTGRRSSRPPSANESMTDRGRTSTRKKLPDNNATRDSNFRRSTSVGVLSGPRRGTSQSPVRSAADEEKLQRLKKRINYDPRRSAAEGRAQDLRRRAENRSRNGCNSGPQGSLEDDLFDSSGGSIDKLLNDSTHSNRYSSTGSRNTSDDDVSPGVYRRRDAGGAVFNDALARFSASVAGDINALSRVDLTENRRSSDDDLINLSYDRILMRMVLTLSQNINKNAGLLVQRCRSSGTKDSTIDEILQSAKTHVRHSDAVTDVNKKLEEIVQNLSSADRRLTACVSHL